MNYLDQFKAEATIRMGFGPIGSEEDYKLEFYFFKPSKPLPKPSTPPASVAEPKTKRSISPTATAKPVPPQVTKTTTETEIAEDDEEQPNDAEELEALKAAEALAESKTAQQKPTTNATQPPDEPPVEFGHVKTELRVLTGEEDEPTKERLLEVSLGQLFKMCGVDSPFSATGFTMANARHVFFEFPMAI